MKGQNFGTNHSLVWWKVWNSLAYFKKEWNGDEECAMEVSSRDMEKYLANLSLRISAGSDWEHLTVRTRLEPASCRYLRIPATPDPWLVLTTGGGPRNRNGWSSAFSGLGNLALTSPDKSTEIRWDRGDGSGIETIHVCIDAALFHRFAAENFACDPASDRDYRRLRST